MRLHTGLLAGRESLMTHATALSTVADNLANSNTTGYKNSRVEFGDLLAESVGSLYGAPLSTGNGVLPQEIATLHDVQGSIENTGRELDAALQGKGYFMATNGTDNYYTRAGNFSANSVGNIVTAKGDNVLGFTAASPDTPVPLNVNSVVGTATASTVSTLTGNLDSSAPLVVPPANPATFNEVSAVSSFSTPIRVVDSLGQSHDVALHFFHTEALTWEVQAYVDGAETGGVAGTPVAVGQGALTVEATGTQAEGAVTQIVLNPAWGNGAAAGNITVDLSGFTGFAGNSAVQSSLTDGSGAGTLDGISIAEDGTVNARLSNGEETAIGQLAIANFVAPSGLKRIGETYFIQTEDSGAPVVGLAGTEGRGEVKGSSLESSTVDPANEFVDLIQYQRGYQAGSQVITAVNEIIESTIQLA